MANSTALGKVLKLREQQERTSAAALARSQQTRAQAEQQQRDLDDLTADYRRQFGEITHSNAQQIQQFQRFYAQLNVAVEAQREVVEKCAAVEARDSEIFVAHHRDRLALEKLLQQREAAHKIERLRAERRSQRPLRHNPMV